MICQTMNVAKKVELRRLSWCAYQRLRMVSNLNGEYRNEAIFRALATRASWFRLRLQNNSIMICDKKVLFENFYARKFFGHLLLIGKIFHFVGIRWCKSAVAWEFNRIYSRHATGGIRSIRIVCGVLIWRKCWWIQNCMLITWRARR